MNMDETEILAAAQVGNKPKVLYIKAELLRKRNKLDYFLNRFLDSFGEKMDLPDHNPNIDRFYGEKCAEYSKINRLLRIANAYTR